MPQTPNDQSKSIQPPPDYRGTSENGPFNPPLEIVQVTRRKRGGGLAYIVDGKRTDDTC